MSNLGTFKGDKLMAKGKFSLTDLLNSKSKISNIQNADIEETTRAGNEFKVDLISVNNLEPSADNFYSVEDVSDLKDSIELLGVQQNLTVIPIPNSNKYKVLAGHRRRLASLQLVEEGKDQFEYVPCRVETTLNDIKQRILLIYTNSTTRQLSDWEKVEQLSQLKELLKEYKKEHEIPGRVRELLAETLNISITQVGRIESINNNLTAEFKDELKKDHINFSTAAELSRLPTEDQQAVYEQHIVKGSTNLNDLKEKTIKTVIAERGTVVVMTERERLDVEKAGNFIRGILVHLIARTPSMKAEINECLLKLSVIEQYLPIDSKNS